jgi:hypothetical protein
VEDFWALRLDMSESFAKRLPKAADGSDGRVHWLARRVLSRSLNRPRVEFPAEVLIVSGTKGRSGLT